MGNISSNKTSPIFSAHSLQTFADCARRFELTYLEGLVWPAVEREPVLESERFLANGRTFHEMVHRDILSIPVAIPKEEEIARWWQHYLEYQPANLEGERYPEKTLAGELNGHVLTATYDLIVITPEGKAKIFDWKTWRHPERVKEVELRLQSRIYPFLLVAQASAIAPSLQLKPEDVEMIYWLAERPAEPIIIDYNQATYLADKDYLQALVEDVLSTHPGDYMLAEDKKKCKFCPYRSFCDRGDVAGNVEDEALVDDAEQSISLIGDLDDYEAIAF